MIIRKYRLNERPLRLAIGLVAALALAACAIAPQGVSHAPPDLKDPTLRPTVPTPRAEAQPEPASLAPVTIRIDSTVRHQVIEGFGATVNDWFDLKTGEDLMGELRPRMIEAVYGQVGITMGQLEVSPYENFDPVGRTTANDDDDPSNFNWNAFNFIRSEGQKTGIVDPARRYGFDNYTIHGGPNTRWADPWLAVMRRTDYRRYLAEVAENAVAPLVYWRDHFGIVTRWHHLFNEPTTGNTELAGGTAQDVVDIVKAVGARLRREGFATIRLVVASEESEEASLATARVVLDDPQARAYVGAIGFHTYPYGSIYSEVGRILDTSGTGRPDAGRIKVRTELRDLARRYGLQVWMTEVSNGRAGPLDSLRGRAIHIHDELLYADASSYWGMFQAWDANADRGTCDEDCLVHFNRARGTVSITGMGYAIGHYARWVRRGAVRIEAGSEDPLVLVSAFQDDASKRVVAVVVNNHREPLAVNLSVSGIRFVGDLKAEQSSAQGYWLPIDSTALGEDGSVSIGLPGRSVTSVSATFR
jgi:O-glycosyl hydrolase